MRKFFENYLVICAWLFSVIPGVDKLKPSTKEIFLNLFVWGLVPMFLIAVLWGCVMTVYTAFISWVFLLFVLPALVYSIYKIYHMKK